MSKTKRLIKMFTELAEELDLDLGEDMRDVWLYRDGRAVVNATFNEKGPTEIYVYSSVKGYEEYLHLAVVRKSEIRKIAQDLIEGISRY